MNRLKVLLIVVLCGVALGFGKNRWESDLEKLIETGSSEQQDEYIKKIVKSNPSWIEVVNHIQDIQFPPASADSVYLRKTITVDGVERSWILYVPPGYDPSRPTPLFVALHGGVSRGEPIPDSLALKYIQDNVFRMLAEKQGWLMLYPLGQMGATWWDEVGMSNIDNLVRTVKREFNVDDDRVWMGGYSDGASGSFLYGMINPDDYGAFLALSGHIGVGSLDGGLYTYVTNLYNTPIYAVTSFDDPLYPSAKMRPTIKVAIEARGDIYYREQEGEHDFSYAEDESVLLVNFLNRHPRDPFPPRIVWETADSMLGRCRWLEINSIDDHKKQAGWYQDYNLTLRDDRIIIGINLPKYEGEGILVGKVFDQTAAYDMGLAEGDIIISGDGMKINNLEDLMVYKKTKQRGDSISFTVLRGDEKLTLSGKLPEIKDYSLFIHDVPSAVARASFFANTIDLQTSRVGSLTIYVHPDMIRLERPLVVNVDGQEVYNQKVEPDLEFLLRNYLENRDRKLLYVAEVRLDL